MIKDIGAAWVILGHSERRHVFGESDEVRDSGVERWYQTHHSVKAGGSEQFMGKVGTGEGLTATYLISLPSPVDWAEGGSCSC